MRSPAPKIDRRDLAEILKDAVEEVGPDPERVAECRDWIRSAMRTMRSVPRGSPSPATLRDRLLEYSAPLLRKARRELRNIGMPTAALDRQVELVEATAARIKIPTGGRLPNETGEVAAALAYLTLRRFGRPVKKTVGSSYFHLASLLSEVATGIEGEDLSRQCRKAISEDADGNKVLTADAVNVMVGRSC